MRQLIISACSDCGLTREKNEDMLLVGDHLVRDDVFGTEYTLQSDDRCVLAVCDGVGGRRGGEVASHDAAKQLSMACKAMPAGLDAAALQQQMERWHLAEHCRLNDMARCNGIDYGMGTTLVSLLFYEDIVMWLNCGDSRLYRYRDGILRQLTTDHSLYNLTHRPEDMHIITNSLGAGDDVPSYIDSCDISSQVHDGDIFLLCSDGVYDRVPDDELEHLIGGGADASTIVMVACEFGTQDNVSAIVARVAQPETE